MQLLGNLKLHMRLIFPLDRLQQFLWAQTMREYKFQLCLGPNKVDLHVRIRKSIIRKAEPLGAIFIHSFTYLY